MGDVRTAGGIVTQKSYLDELRDPGTGRYFAPYPLDDSFYREAVVSYYRMLSRHLPEGRPFRELYDEMSRMAGSVPEFSMAVIDTGLMLEHPLLRDRVVASEDLTGEGPADLNGHGTVVALVLLLREPTAKLINVKTFDSSGRGSEEALARAIELAVEMGARSINISGGVYHKRWRVFECRADCAVCLAAEKAAVKGLWIAASAGDEPGRVNCPARLGLGRRFANVTATGLDEGAPAGPPGTGSILGIKGRFEFRRVG